MASQPRGPEGIHQAWLSKQGTSGQSAGKNFATSPANERPLLLVDGYNNFVSSHHVQPDACRRFDSARISAELFNFQAQRIVCLAQSLNIRLHSNVLLRRRRHSGSGSHDDCGTNGRNRKYDHAKNYPRRNNPAAPAHLSRRADDVLRNFADRRERRARPSSNPLRPNSFINPI